MNDFTKEELQFLYDELDWSIVKYDYEDERAYSCLDKLKSMIDTHPTKDCSHKSNGNHYLNGHITAIPTDIYKCKYCNKLYKCIFENGIRIVYEELNDNP